LKHIEDTMTKKRFTSAYPP